MAPTSEQLVADNLPLARMLAGKWARKVPHMAEDFEAAALAGLWYAARTYDSGRGVKFGTYAAWRVAGEVQNFARSCLPAGMRTRNRSLRPTCKVLPLQTAENDAGEQGQFDPQDPSGPVGWEADSLAGIDTLTRGLPSQCREAIRRYYGDASTASMKAVGRAMNLSESRVSQLISEGLDMMRERESLNGVGCETAATVETSNCPTCHQPKAGNGRCYKCRPGGPHTKGKVRAKPTAVKPPVARTTGPVPELAALRAVLDALAALDADAARRVVRCVSELVPA